MVELQITRESEDGTWNMVHGTHICSTCNILSFFQGYSLFCEIMNYFV